MELATSKFINSNASQDLLDFTATNYDICNLAILVIFSIYMESTDIWSLYQVSAKDTFPLTWTYLQFLALLENGISDKIFSEIMARCS